MTEVTRVPLHPIAKGSLTKVWLGILLAILIGAGLAWAAVPKGVSVETLTEGTGPSPKLGDVAFVKYVGKLTDGTVFDESRPGQFPEGLFPEGTPFLLEEGQVVDGFLEGLLKTKKGGKYVLHIPAEKAYGDDAPEGSPIPPGSDLVFEVEVTDFMAREDAERRLQMLQQMMQQGQDGAPGAGPGAGSSAGPAGPPTGPSGPPQGAPGN